MAALLAWGVSVAPASAQRDGGLLPPDESAKMTVSGCLMAGVAVDGAKSDKYVLANPTSAPLTSVPDQRCSADFTAPALRLDNYFKGAPAIDGTNLGRWVQIFGRLEKEGNIDLLREFDVLEAILIPQSPPRVAVREPEPAPAPAPFEAVVIEETPVPVATSGELPKTAGFLPLAGLVGLFACGGGLMLRSLRRQRA